MAELPKDVGNSAFFYWQRNNGEGIMKTLYKINHKRGLKLFFVILIIGIFIVPDALGIPLVPDIPPFPVILSSGNTYHVDGDHPNAQNFGNHYATAYHPWKTLQFAIDKLSAGDTLIVHESAIDYDKWLSIDTAGADNNWITIMGAEGEIVELYDARLNFGSNAKYIHFKDIDFKSGIGRWSIIDIIAGASNLAIEGVEIDCGSSADNYTGIWTREGVNNVWFKDMDIHHCGYSKTNPTDCSGICLKEPAIDEITFLNVTVRDNKGDGIGSCSDPSSPRGSVYFDRCTSKNNTGDGFDMNASRVILKNSVSSNNGPDQGVGFKSWSKETWIVNYLSFDNTYEAIMYRPHWEESKLYVLNSTLVGNNKTHYGGQIRIGQDYPSLGYSYLYLYNTIFHSVNTKAVVFEDINRQILAEEDNNFCFSANDPALPRAGEIIAFQFRDTISNIVASYTFSEMGDGTWFASEGVGEHDIGMTKDGDGLPDPGFVDLDNENYRLRSDSLAVDAGIELGLTEDHEGTPVPQGISPDIGAYEFKDVWLVNYELVHSRFINGLKLWEHKLKLYLKNNGVGTALKVSGLINAHPDHITVVDGKVRFNDLYSGMVLSSADNFKILTSEPELDLSEVEWLLEYDDSNGNHITSIAFLSDPM